LPLVIFLAQTPLDALAALLLPLVYALGDAGRGLRLSALWVALTWLFCAAAILLWPRLVPDPNVSAGPALTPHALAALPLGYALSTLLALLLILRALPSVPLRGLNPLRPLVLPLFLSIALYLALRLLMLVFAP
jgi:hypothetical protein